MRTKFWHFGLAMIGIIGFVALSTVLDERAGIRFDMTYRVVCAVACLAFIAKLASDYAGESWPRISLILALLLNASLFLTPLMKGASSRGEIVLFALPDAVIVLGARLISYTVEDVHQRAVRQQLVLGFIVAVTVCAILFSLALIHPR